MAPAVALRGRRTVQERALSRRRLGSLRSLKISAKTQARYAKAFQLFMSWLQAAHPQRFTSTLELVQFVCDFLEVLWSERGAKSLAGDVLSSLQWHLPQLKPRLKEGWDLFAVWTRAEEVTRAAPFTREMLLAFATHLIESQRPAVACALW
eukprot:1041288-Amphidinium_carterae.1